MSTENSFYIAEYWKKKPDKACLWLFLGILRLYANVDNLLFKKRGVVFIRLECQYDITKLSKSKTRLTFTVSFHTRQIFRFTYFTVTSIYDNLIKYILYVQLFIHFHQKIKREIRLCTTDDRIQTNPIS